MMRILWLTCAIGLAAACLLPVMAAQGPGKKAQEDPFFSGPAFSLDDILQRVGVIADKRLATAIERRGVNFSPSPADYDRLKQAGAGAEILHVIQAKAPPPPPSPPPPKPKPEPRAGPLNLACAPPDCEVSVNGRSHGRTIDGKLQVRDLPPGEAVIDFSKQGFESQQVTVALRPGMPAGRAVTLKPTPVTQAAFGKQLLGKMIDHLGGDAGLQQASLLTASGNASLWIAGQRTDWQVTSKLKLPDMALVEINGAKQKWWTSVNAGESKSDGTRRMAGGPVALEMEKLARLYRDYQLGALTARLQKMNVSAPQAAPEPDGTWLMRAAGPDGVYKITLDKDLNPQRVVYESPSGLGSGLEVLYLDYQGIQKTIYPKSMTIKFADQQQHGLELRFSDIQLQPKLTDKDFHR